MNWRLMTLALAAAALSVGCSRTPELPDPSDPDVRADADTMAVAAAADLERVDRTSGGPQADWACTGELFGRDADALLGVVSCTGTYAGEPGESGVSAPVRVDAGKVSWAADGSAYAQSVRDLWGEELANAYLDR